MVGEAEEDAPAAAAGEARRVERRALISSFGLTLRDKPNSKILIASFGRPVFLESCIRKQENEVDNQGSYVVR